MTFFMVKKSDIGSNTHLGCHPTFLRDPEALPKPAFATGILGGGVGPNLVN